MIHISGSWLSKGAEVCSFAEEPMLKSEEIRWFALRVGTRQQRAVFRAGPEDGYGLFSPFEEARHDHTDHQASNFLTPSITARLGSAGVVDTLL